MKVEPLDLPYQMDVTYLTPVVNIIILKIVELAKEFMVILPSEVRPYTEVDLANFGQILQKINGWQTLLVNGMGLDGELIPLKYQAIDYNHIISTLSYYGGTMNKIIDAAYAQHQ